MKRVLSIGLILLVAFTCFIVASKNAQAKGLAAQTTLSDQAQGWWLLHEYHDRILNNRKVGEFSFEPPVWDAIVIHVTGDSVFSSGNVIPIKVTARQSGDTIRTESMTSSATYFIYKKKKKELIVEFTNSKGVREVFHYRMFRSNEFVSLTKGLFDRKEFWPLRANYHKWLSDYLLVGTYTCVNDQSKLILGTDESVIGFQKWPAFKIDDFFGTIHWTEKNDRIRFEVSNKTGAFKDYNWRWSNDTLILRPFLGQSIESYKIGQQELKYVRQVPN